MLLLCLLYSLWLLLCIQMTPFDRVPCPLSWPLPLSVSLNKSHVVSVGHASPALPAAFCGLGASCSAWLKFQPRPAKQQTKQNNADWVVYQWQQKSFPSVPPVPSSSSHFPQCHSIELVICESRWMPEPAATASMRLKYLYTQLAKRNISLIGI